MDILRRKLSREFKVEAVRLVTDRGVAVAQADLAEIAALMTEADRPHRKWPADFTYIWTGEGWVHVAVVPDLFSRPAVGWSMKATRDASLIMDALMMAIWRRGTADALLHLSDEGSQYISEQCAGQAMCRIEP